jgi:hypothetical protein
MIILQNYLLVVFFTWYFGLKQKNTFFNQDKEQNLFMPRLQNKDDCILSLSMLKYNDLID